MPVERKRLRLRLVAISRFPQFAELVPVVACASVVLAAEYGAAVGRLHQRDRRALVFHVERAVCENPLAPAVPRDGLLRLGKILRNPPVEIEWTILVMRMIMRAFCSSASGFRGCFDGCVPADGLHECSSRRPDPLRDRDDPCLPVGTVVQRVALAVHRPRDAPDSGGVEDGHVHLHGVRGGLCDLLYAFLHQPVVVGREVDAVEHLRPVARIQHDGFRPAKGGQAVPDLPRQREGGLVLDVRRGDARWPHGVAVYRPPAAAQHVAVGGRVVAPGGRDAVVRPAKEGGGHGVERHIRPAVRVELRNGLRRLGDVVVVEVARFRVGPRVFSRHGLQHADLEHVPGGEERPQEADGLVAAVHGVSSLAEVAFHRGELVEDALQPATEGEQAGGRAERAEQGLALAGRDEAHPLDAPLVSRLR